MGLFRLFYDGQLIKHSLGIRVDSPFHCIARGVDTDDHWQFRHACSEITYQKRYNVEKLQSEDHRYVVTDHTPDVPFSSDHRSNTIYSLRCFDKKFEHWSALCDATFSIQNGMINFINYLSG